MSIISTHVLDVARGEPARGIAVTLQRLRPDQGAQSLGEGVTDHDGRCKSLLQGGTLQPGTHRLVFDTGSYFRAQNVVFFYPLVVVLFEVRDATQNYHIPLLLSPFGYSTYRGS